MAGLIEARSGRISLMRELREEVAGRIDDVAQESRLGMLLICSLFPVRSLVIGSTESLFRRIWMLTAPIRSRFERIGLVAERGEKIAGRIGQIAE